MKVHMSLPMKSKNETIAFYSILFGEKPVKIKEDYIKFDPVATELNISFHLKEKTDSMDVSRHLGFEISTNDELEKIYEHFKNAGLTIEEKKVSNCCYANQDKFWVVDPVGFKWEIYTVLENTTEKQNEKTTCCVGEDNESKRNYC